MRRILLFIFLLLLVGTGVWYFFIRTNTASDTNPITSVFESFFPGTGTSGDTTLDGIIPDGTNNPETNNTNRFTQISTRPIAGYSVFALTNTLTIPNPDPTLKPIITTIVDHYVRYVARNNGYVYEIKNDSPSTQVSNILIPNIYEAVFSNNNTVALLRFLKPDNQTIATYSVPIPALNTDGTRTQTNGTYLTDNIDSLAMSPDSLFVGRLTKDSTGALISTTTTTNTTKRDLLRTPFTEWLLMWPIQNAVYVQTKAAATVAGYLYRVDSVAGRLRRVVGDVAGLTTSISPNAEYVLYSESVQNSFVTRLFNTKAGTTSNISLKILPEKCVWYTNNDLLCAGSNDITEGVYPDSWYAGLTHFEDQLYRIDTKSNTYSVVFDGTDRSFDMTQLKLDEGQNLLYFIDKTTGLLWKFAL